MRLCGDVDQADDLVQETALKALNNPDGYQEGTNFHSWLFKILQNTYLSARRRHRREVPDTDGLQAAEMEVPPDQIDHITMDDLERAWGSLSIAHQDVLRLVGIQGLDYKTAAEILGIHLGTVKSRVHRGRVKLSEMLDGELPKESKRNRQIRTSL
jgi:RNA polymerase sigma-70 factor (ECF subfamily)